MKTILIILAIMFPVLALASEATIPYLDAGLKMIGENKSIATLLVGWVMNLVWKAWPTANPSGVIHKIRDFLFMIKQKQILDKILDLCDVLLGIFDLVTSPIPNREKK